MEEKYCSTCGSVVAYKAKFCHECGALLTDNNVSATPIQNIPFNTSDVPVKIENNNIPKVMGKRAPEDKSLTMLAEYCIKTVATVGGDGYTEWVLNRKVDGTLQLDYYKNYVGYTEEIHEIFPAPLDTFDRILKIKEQYSLKNPEQGSNFTMCGGYSLVKICGGDSVIRLTNANLSDKERTAFSEIQKILTSIS